MNLKSEDNNTAKAAEVSCSARYFLTCYNTGYKLACSRNMLTTAAIHASTAKYGNIAMLTRRAASTRKIATKVNYIAQHMSSSRISWHGHVSWRFSVHKVIYGSKEPQYWDISNLNLATQYDLSLMGPIPVRFF